MRLLDIYQMAIEMGMACDVRGEHLEYLMTQQRFDDEGQEIPTNPDSLQNPYADTRILVGPENKEIHTVLCGIDIETPEILLADRLNQKGHNIDLIIGHHPRGIAAAELHEVMHVQADMLEEMGVPINVGEGIMSSRIKEVQRGRMSANHQRAVDAARLLDFSFMCVHSAADNLASHYVKSLMNDSRPATVGQVIDLLMQVPEYIEGNSLKAGPTLVSGYSKNRTGKVFVKFTGGTAGSEKAYEKLVQAGVGTMICMHMSEKHIALARENNLNVVIAGHMASDSLGMNLFLDELEKRQLNIIPCSGLIRVKRFWDSDLH